MSAPPPRTPDDLLKWSIAAQNADGLANGEQNMHEIADEVAQGKRPDLADPALYDALMGKSEATMMKEELAVAMDLNRNEKDRVQALDNFEMLIESIDNANNIKSMKLWEPIISLLTHPQSTPPIQHATLWIIGTAVQNNDKAQMSILDFEPLAPLLDLLKSSSDGEVRSKAMYAISGILKHNPKAVDLFGKSDGWVVLKGALLDSNVSLRRKAAFLVNSLLLQDDTGEEKESSAPVDTPATGSTAIAPVDTPPASTLPTAPLEQLPATLTSGVLHPSIPPLLVSSSLLDALILSLLPASLQSTIPASVLDKIETISTVGGPDGDIELREDLDFSEKGVRTCLTFVEKVKEHGGSATFDDKKGLAQARSLLKVLAQELNGKAIESEEGIEFRWQELGLSSGELEAFVESVGAL
ncbi:hypothetical protein CBS101457_003326 [Exobasidium rhododendri]|nr:hypothetical protein CBS101457_003326 [Exobasidium rhododendri]